MLECVLLLHTERKKSDSTTPSTTPSVDSSDVEYYEGDEEDDEDPFMGRHKKRKTEKGIMLHCELIEMHCMYTHCRQANHHS